MVERERNALKPGGLVPMHVSIRISRKSSFVRGDVIADPDVPSPLAAGQIEIWKKIVDVQQHFNDLELRVRNCADRYRRVPRSWRMPSRMPA